jgi:hypothetical protein
MIGLALPELLGIISVECPFVISRFRETRKILSIAKS